MKNKKLFLILSAVAICVIITIFAVFIINQIDTLLQPSDDTSMTSIQNARSLQQKLTQLISNN